MDTEKLNEDCFNCILNEGFRCNCPALHIMIDLRQKCTSYESVVNEREQVIQKTKEEYEDKIDIIRYIINNTENRPIEFADSLNKIKEIINKKRDK